MATTTTPSSTVHVANRAYYTPLYIDRTMTVRKLWWANGSAVSGFVDIGIYASAAGLPTNRIISAGMGAGIVAQTPVNTIQEVDIADTELVGPGLYFMGIAADNATSTFFATGVGTATISRAAGLMMQTTGGMPLPATAAPITTLGIAVIMHGPAVRQLAA